MGKKCRPRHRREYDKEYYRTHREQARAYQRAYNQDHKRKVRLRAPRAKIRETFNTSDIMQAPVEKAQRMFEQICSGERSFTM